MESNPISELPLIDIDALVSDSDLESKKEVA
jgi:hypothetical protein